MRCYRLGFCLLSVLLFGQPALGRGAKDDAILKDIHGDPLPRGALARMGTIRMRHPFGVVAYALAPDGGRVTSLGLDGSLVEWDTDRGSRVRGTMLKFGTFSAAAFSPDRRLVATIGYEGGSAITDKTNRTLRLWNVATGKEIVKITDSARTIGGLAFAQDGKTLASVSQGHVIHLWAIPSGKLILKMDGKEKVAMPVPLDFSPDGATLASGGNDGVIRFWNTRTGEKAREIRVPLNRKMSLPRREVYSVRFSPDGKNLASSGYLDNTVWVWDAANGKAFRRFDDQALIVREFVFTREGQGLVFWDKDFVLREVDIQTGEERRRFRHGIFPALTPDAKNLGMVSGNSIVVWDLTQGKDRQPVRGHPGRPGTMFLTPDGKTLVTGDGREVWSWDIATGRPRSTFLRRTSHTIVGVSPDSKMFVTVDRGDTTRIWTLEGKEVDRLQGPNGNFFATRVLANGKLIASKYGGDITSTNLATGKTVKLAKAPLGSVRITVAPDEARALWYSASQSFQLLNLTSGKVRWQITPADVFSPSMAFSGDGSRFAIADSGGVARPDRSSIRIHHTATGKELCHFAKGAGPFYNVALSADGRTVATGGTPDRSIHIWEINAGRVRQKLFGHGAYVQSLIFPPAGKTLISASSDGTCLVWDMTGKYVPRAPGDLDALWAALASPDAAKAYQAILALTDVPAKTVPFLATKVQPEKPVPAADLVRLIIDLNSKNLPTRSKAIADLEKLDELAEPALRKALGERPTVELRRRIDGLLTRLPRLVTSLETIRQLRAVEALERMGTPDAIKVLDMIAKGAPGGYLTRDAQASLLRLSGAKRNR
ncbi:MAG: PQQ-binding-like beta-propeller repeat protein [Planctomycetes bacterium]|nr:PQQ-binding-like beta-propeller repeat protein [Planctomycetota bacterium]